MNIDVPTLMLAAFFFGAAVGGLLASIDAERKAQPKCKCGGNCKCNAT